MTRVLVTGATGAIGPRVVQLLCSNGYHVRALSTRASSFDILPNIETSTADITNPEALRSVMRGVDAVIHMAALLHIVNPSPELYDKYERVNVGGTANVVEAARAAGVQRIVFFSTIAVYGSSGSKILDEDSPLYPDTHYAQTKLAAESIILNARHNDGESLGTVLRLGAVYGSRIKGNFQRLVRTLTRRRFLPIGNGDNRRTLIYDKDVARAALLALQHPAAVGKIFNVTDGQFHAVREIIDAICIALGRKSPRVKIPLSTVRLAVGLLEDAAKLIGRTSPVGRATLEKFTEEVAVDGQRFQTELGFKAHYDLYTGWQEAVRELQESGEL